MIQKFLFERHIFSQGCMEAEVTKFWGIREDGSGSKLRNTCFLTETEAIFIKLMVIPLPPT